MSPKTSVRKSSRRSDHRIPPRATFPARKCTPSMRGEYTKISYFGLGKGRSEIRTGSNLNERYDFENPLSSF